MTQIIDGDRGVNIEGHVLSMSPINKATGYLGQTIHTRHVDILQPDGDQIIVRLWNEQIDLVEQGDYISVVNGFVSTNHHLDITSLHVGRYGTLQVNRESLWTTDGYCTCGKK